MLIKFMKAKCYFIKVLRLLSTVLPFLLTVLRLLSTVFPLLLTVNYKDSITSKTTIVLCLDICTRIQEKKLGIKNGSGKKPDGKKAWSVLERMENAWCLFLRLIHNKINDEVKITHYFNHLILKMCLAHIIYFSSTIYFYQYIIQNYVKFIMFFLF